MDTVSTTCGSGWVHAHSFIGSELRRTHPLPQVVLTVSKYGPELLDIKRGAWPLEKVKAESERLFQLAQEAYVRSSLPSEPDRDRAERLCVEMISAYHKLH